MCQCYALNHIAKHQSFGINKNGIIYHVSKISAVLFDHSEA